MNIHSELIYIDPVILSEVTLYYQKAIFKNLFKIECLSYGNECRCQFKPFAKLWTLALSPFLKH